MAVGMMWGMRASYRDASNAFLQALIDVEPGVINLVELPRSFWPRSWFEDDAMTIPKYKRPAVSLVYALPGPPKVWKCLGRARGINPGQVGLEKKSRIGPVCLFMLTCPLSAYMWMTS